MRSTSRRIAALLLPLALVAGACSNSTTDDADDPATTDATTGDTGGPVTTADLTAFIASDEPGVTDDEIRVSGVASATNPLGGSYGDAFAGTNAYFEMVNSEGGIYGRDLTMVAEHDDAVANNQAEVQAILAQDDVFAVLPVATLQFLGAGELVDAGVPTFGWNINPEWAHEPNLFGEKGSYLCFDCGQPYWPWVARELGLEKVGILAYGISEQSKECAAGWRAGFDKWPTAEVVFFDDTLPFGVPDVSGEVSEMKDAGVDLILTCMDQNGVVTIAREAQRQDLDAIQFLSNAYDDEFVAEFGDLFEGSIVSTVVWPFESTTDQPEGMTNYLRWMEETGGSVNEISMAGWLAADLFVEGLAGAGPEFTRQSVIDAANRLTDWDANGLLAGYDWTIVHDEQDPDGCAAFVQITDGGFESVYGEPGKPFVCLPPTLEELPETPEIRS